MDNMTFTQSAVSVMTHHGVWFLIFIALFPRLTMLFTGICSAIGGPLFWLGWVFFPHIMVAFIATSMYWNTDPFICVISWFIAISGTFSERTVIKYKKKD